MNDDKLSAALVARHAEVTELIGRLRGRLDETDPDTADWTDVATLGHITQRLREALGEDE